MGGWRARVPIASQRPAGTAAEAAFYRGIVNVEPAQEAAQSGTKRHTGVARRLPGWAGGRIAVEVRRFLGEICRDLAQFGAMVGGKLQFIWTERLKS
jgi:hypothetical protein